MKYLFRKFILSNGVFFNSYNDEVSTLRRAKSISFIFTSTPHSPTAEFFFSQNTTFIGEEILIKRQ